MPTCIECGSTVDAGAISCPECGCPATGFLNLPTPPAEASDRWFVETKEGTKGPFRLAEMHSSVRNKSVLYTQFASPDGKLWKTVAAWEIFDQRGPITRAFDDVDGFIERHWWAGKLFGFAAVAGVLAAFGVRFERPFWYPRPPFSSRAASSPHLGYSVLFNDGSELPATWWENRQVYSISRRYGYSFDTQVGPTSSFFTAEGPITGETITEKYGTSKTPVVAILRLSNKMYAVGLQVTGSNARTQWCVTDDAGIELFYKLNNLKYDRVVDKISR